MTTWNPQYCPDCGDYECCEPNCPDHKVRCGCGDYANSCACRHSPEDLAEMILANKKDVRDGATLP